MHRRQSKLDNPEAVLAAVLASSYLNESSCLSHSTEFNLCPLLLLPALQILMYVSFYIQFPLCLTAPHQCNLLAKKTLSTKSAQTWVGGYACWEPHALWPCPTARAVTPIPKQSRQEISVGQGRTSNHPFIFVLIHAQDQPPNKMSNFSSY